MATFSTSEQDVKQQQQQQYRKTPINILLEGF